MGYQNLTVTSDVMSASFGSDIETRRLRKHFEDLARRAEQSQQTSFTEFLTLPEQALFLQVGKEYPALTFALWGGFPQAERVMGSCGWLEEETYPLACLSLQFAHPKYAEALTHRDYLGSILSLGIERHCIGDILVLDSSACFFCVEEMAPYFIRELTRIRHTKVICSRENHFSEEYSPKLMPVEGTVMSIRLDAIIKVGWNLSRASVLPYLEKGLVAVNQQAVTSPSYLPHPGDIISVRGLGRIRYVGSKGTSKRGRIVIELEKYQG